MSTPLDEKYWSQRYRNAETAWDIGYPSTPLKAYFDQLQNKQLKILIPGAGNAYEAEYLVDQGFTDVSVCDLSAVPLQNLRARVKNQKPLHLIQGDFFELSGQYDLIIEQTFFCALQPGQRQHYFQKMRELLAPGGKLMGVLFNDRLNDDRPPFGGSREEYVGYIAGSFEIVKFETCSNSIPPRQGREIFMLLRKNGGQN